MERRARDLLIVVAVVAVAWLALMAGLSHWQRGGKSTGPNLPHYPGQESVQEQTSPNLGWRKYWFPSPEEYPATRVYDWYRGRLQQEGWEIIGEDPARWHRQEEKEAIHDIMDAVWVTRDHLFQLELEMVSTTPVTRQGSRAVVGEREPGMKVYVTLRRVTLPWIVPDRGQKSPGGQIEIPAAGRGK